MGTTIVYILVTLAAITRVVSPLLPDVEVSLLVISGGFWVAAFSLFVVLYARVLLLPALANEA